MDRKPSGAIRAGDPLDVEYRRAPTRNEDFDVVVTDLLGYDPGRIGALERRARWLGPNARRFVRFLGVAVFFVRLLCRVPIGGLNVADEGFC